MSCSQKCGAAAADIPSWYASTKMLRGRDRSLLGFELAVALCGQNVICKSACLSMQGLRTDLRLIWHCTAGTTRVSAGKSCLQVCIGGRSVWEAWVCR